MWDKNNIEYFRKSLLDWFDSNKRDFPWRKDNISNYEVIFSEILLQRTKAETVAKHYKSFFEKYPNWEMLILATDKELEDIFKPFGLHTQRVKRTRKIIDEYNARMGNMSFNKNELQESSLSSLYLKNAYELFILKNNSPLLDVNMSRVLGRFFSIKDTKEIRNNKELQDLAKEIVDINECKELNWAILDFAAQVCKSRIPNCRSCVISSQCNYYNLSNNMNNTVEEPQLTIGYDSQLPKKPNKPLKVLSLFSGCGGMDLGFEGGFTVHKNSVNEKINPGIIAEHLDNDLVKLKPTKFETVFANDILIDARNTWVNYFEKRNYSPDIYHVESIVNLVKMHKKGYPVFPEKVDVVTGGFPCQDFSVAGKRKGFKSNKDHKGDLIKDNAPSIETRGKLYMWMKEVIEITKPKVFIAENVKGLVNLSDVKEIIQKDFSSIDGNGYLVLEPQVLHSANYGVPQSRERVIFIGIKKSELNSTALEELSSSKINQQFYPYPKPTHSFNVEGKKLVKAVSLKSIFDGLVEPEFTNDLSHKHYSKAKFMGKHCQGQTEVDMNGISPTIRSEHHGNIEFRRLSIENGGKQFEEIEILNLKQRRLTPRECALIQTFPPDYEFVIPSNKSRFLVSPSAAYKLIGNAVPPLLAYHIAIRIESLWNLYFNQQTDGNIVKPRAKQVNIPITA